VSVGGDHVGQGERAHTGAPGQGVAEHGQDVAEHGQDVAEHGQGRRPAGIQRAPKPRSAAGRAADLMRTESALSPDVGLPPDSVPRQLDTCGVDDTDFGEFVTVRGRSLLRSAYLLTGNLADAEDLVQSALAKTYQAWDRIEDRKALEGYVRRAIVNTHISWWRRRRVDEYPTAEIPDQPIADTTGNSELHDTLQRAIDRLPHRMRAAVVLRFFEDMTEAEVADVLGVSQGTVKSTVSRAVAKLRTDTDLLAE
jgi:RNA polymerase sigma-70 factor (sigma-E family)